MKIIKINLPDNITRWLVIIAATLAVAITINLFQAPIHDKLNSWKLLPTTRVFTELYFSKLSSIPPHYPESNIQKLNFTVKNIEGRQTEYKYQVIQSSNGYPDKVLAEDSFALRPNESKEIIPSIYTEHRSVKAMIQVRLTFKRIKDKQVTEQTQTIHYWINNKGETQ